MHLIEFAIGDYVAATPYSRDPDAIPHHLGEITEIRMTRDGVLYQVSTSARPYKASELRKALPEDVILYYAASPTSTALELLVAINTMLKEDGIERFNASVTRVKRQIAEDAQLAA